MAVEINKCLELVLVAREEEIFPCIPIDWYV